MGVQGCALAERKRQVPASAIGASIRVPFSSACMRNGPNTNKYIDKLNANNSKHNADGINKHATRHDFPLDKVDKATQESREFALSEDAGAGLQVGEDAAQQQSSPWQGGQVSLSLILCVNVMQCLLAVVFTVSMFYLNLSVHDSLGSILYYFCGPICTWVLWYRRIFLFHLTTVIAMQFFMYAYILPGIPT